MNLSIVLHALLFAILGVNAAKKVPSFTKRSLSPYDDAYHLKNVKSTGIAATGSTYELSCGHSDAVHCRLISPSGEVTIFDGPCKLTIKGVSDKDFGEWTCKVLIPTTQDEISASYWLMQEGKALVELGVQSYLDKILLTCSLRSEYCVRPVRYCLMERPNGKKMLLRKPISSVGKYRMEGNGTEVCDCSMTIHRPLKMEDYGYWRCVMATEPGRFEGGFLSIENTLFPAVSEVKSTVYRHPENGIVKNEQSFVIGWRVNRPLEFCWLKKSTSKGELIVYGHPGQKNRNALFQGLGLDLGECLIKVTVPYIGDGWRKIEKRTENWILGMGIKDKDILVESQTDVNITVTDWEFFSKHDTVIQAPGESATLECILASGRTLNYCSFEMPNKKVISLVDGFQTERLSQFGAGMKHGICGIEVKNLQEEDFGQWACFAQTITGEGKQATISLKKP